MKLLYFTIQFNMAGGLARIVTDKVNWLVEHGYEVSICNIEPLEVIPYYPLDKRVKLIRGNIQTTPGGILTRFKGMLKAISRMRSVIESEKPDLIVNAHCPLVTWLLPFSYRRIPKIVEIHQSRQGLEVFNRQFMSPMGQWLHRWSIRWIYGRYDRFVCLTSEDANAWILKNAINIPNFTSIQDIAVKEIDGKDLHQIILLARLMPQKRIDLMMQVWALVARDFPNWHVKVLGDGMERRNLEKLRAELGIEESFLLPGSVSNVSEDLAESDILCLTSEYEGFGIVLIEAMQVGVPVIAFEYVGVHDIIDDGKTGYIVPFGEVDTYALRLRQLMTDKEERERLASGAKASLSKFDKELVMHQWTDLFHSLSARPVLDQHS